MTEDENTTSERLAKAREYHAAIRLVLLNEWDPIGVSDVPEAQDEYDSYVGEIYALLIRRRPVHEVFDLLWWIETEHMGLLGSHSRTQHVAERLTALGKELSGS